MPPLNILISQFFGLCLIAGGVLWALLAALFGMLGFADRLAGSLAGIISMALIAWFVFGRRRSRTEKSPLTRLPPSQKHRIGSTLVTVGNTAFGFAAILVVALSRVADPVVGGIVVYIGGAFSLICWIVGWHLTEYFKII